jgi:hypothetical protein
MDLQKYLVERVPSIEESGVWHVAKVILNKDQFSQEPLVTKAMGITSRNCAYCKKEQENSEAQHVFCRRHLMVYELKKFYLFESTPVFKYHDLYLFPQKYCVKWFENVVVCSFSSRSVSKEDIYYLLKFSFLKRDIKPQVFTNVIDISELDTFDCLNINLSFVNLDLENNKNGFIVKQLTIKED